ncbi:uncharacterized protein OCT59_017030 [Rhizophagus irregularis]|uniref:uncharacterized protein n=1 Tax=Rhizophagus irregularis TaxID=588596 RepID=UPI0019F2BC52|nr:hypothetical protein OCT59_017030 [Rhizophagus irregularis]GBC14681.2 hypothetical protein GLOIN_2v1471944 [Rhizophagus irregularis DAOM 181602=DAOM 197198]
MSENSSYDKLINNNEPVRFFYELRNAVYFIECQESRPGVNEYSDKNDPLNFIFPCEHLNTKKKYRLSCKKLSTTFVTQALNNIIFNINLNPIEQQKREFSENDKNCLESHLKNDLPKCLTNYKPNDFMYRAFFELYTSYESTIRQNNDYNNSNCQVTLPSNSQSYGYVAAKEIVDETFNRLLQESPSFLQYYQNNGLLDTCRTEESQLLASVNEIGNIHQHYDDYNKGIVLDSLSFINVGYHGVNLKFKTQSRYKPKYF